MPYPQAEDLVGMLLLRSMLRFDLGFTAYSTITYLKATDRAEAVLQGKHKVYYLIFYYIFYLIFFLMYYFIFYFIYCFIFFILYAILCNNLLNALLWLI